MDPLGAAAIGMGLWNGITAPMREAAKQKQSAQLRAAEIEASPWTKMGPQTQIQFAGNPAGSITAGLGSGLAMAQNLEKNSSDQKMNEALMGMWNRMGQQPQSGSFARTTPAAPTLMGGRKYADELEMG